MCKPCQARRAALAAAVKDKDAVRVMSNLAAGAVELATNTVFGHDPTPPNSKDETDV